MARFFQPDFFQNDFYQTVSGVGVLTITDTDILQKPIDAVLAGQQKIKDRYREYELHAPRLRTRASGTHTGVGRLKGDKPSFKVTTTKKGYD
jgi:hypothetical protein